MMSKDISLPYEESQAIFEELSERVETLLMRFGRPRGFQGEKRSDFMVQGDYYGNSEVVVFVQNLELLRPDIIEKLYKVISDFPGWQLALMVAIPGHYRDWPEMGIFLNKNEIVDDLKREYFPERYQSIEFPGARKSAPPDVP